jgi:thymidylate synthase
MLNKVPPLVQIQAHGLPDAWHKAIKECIKRGAINTRDYGKPVRTKVIVSTIEIGNPLCEPMLHEDFPTKELHLNEYIKQWERGYDWKRQGFAYNYMARLIGYPRTDIASDRSGYYKIKQCCENTIDQIKIVKERIASRIAKGEDCSVSNRDQIITWVPERDLIIDEDQPCMQRIQIFVYSHPRMDSNILIPGKGEFHVDWRSRDLFAAWNSNMIGLTLMLKREIFDPNKIKIIRCVDHCSSLHIYEGDWETAEKVRPVTLMIH